MWVILIVMIVSILSINNKPYEGLKRASITLDQGSFYLSINNKPYEGLKLSLQFIETIRSNRSFQLTINPMRD